MLVTSLLAGCPDRGISEVVPNQDKAEVKDIPLQLNRNLDLLFVIDNSGSMKEEQTGLAANFPKFVQVLQQVQGGLPDVHMGVVSSNMGAGNNGINNCTPPGDAGHLLQGPGGTHCSGLDPNAKFISDVSDGANGRTTNYTGDLGTLFSCMAQLGTDGCGLEAHLESMRTALDPANAFNAGFIRKDAYLGIVIIGDEDDCSAKDPSVFSPSDTAKGPINFRCAEYGVTCDGDTDPLHMQVKGVRANCKPREDSQYIFPVQRYIDFVKGLKSDPKSIVVADIGAPKEPWVIGDNTYEQKPTEPALQASCQSSTGFAVPTLRVQTFTGAFPDRNSFSTICNTDFSDALINIAQLIKEVIGDPCIEGTLKDIDLNTPGVQPDCVVSQVTDPGTAMETEKILPECDGSHSNTPCWTFQTDAMQCASTPSMLKLVTDYGNNPAPLNTHIKAQCVVQ
ncbi:MAG TPA: hypothetical protein VL463_11060 [Kofleriaceae bacterium]|nr:hypothetical protein [Kofleriaceae bacterium]